MALAIHSSSPPLVTGASQSSTVTTAAFNPPAGSVLVACIPANSGSATSPTLTVTDSDGALVWSPRALANFASATARRGTAAIYTAPIPANLTGLTVTVTTGGATATTRRPTLKVYVVTGQDAANLVASSGIAGGTANNLATVVTQAVANSLLIVCASEWQKLGAPTSPDLTATPFDQAGADGISGLTGYRALDATAGSELATTDAFGTAAAEWNVAWIELRPLAGATTTRTNLAPHPAYARGTAGGAQWFGAAGSGPATGVVGMERTTGFADPAGTGNIATPRAAVTAGLSYAASVQIRADLAGPVTVGIDWYSAAGWLAGSSVPSVPFEAGIPQRVGMIGVAPDTAVEGVLTIRHPESPIIATALLWEQGTEHGTYFDGETVGAVWTGTRYSSTSTLTRAADPAPVVGAGADAALTVPGTFTRTATESGSGITSRAWTILSGPADVGATLSTVATLTGWAPSVAGVYVLRYTATNAGGPGTDDVTVTVSLPPAPTVSAGADAVMVLGTPFTRTATEAGSSITARAWTIVSGPAGAGTTIGPAPSLTWTPTLAGVYVLRYSATNPGGTGTDTVTVIVNTPPAEGVPFLVDELGPDASVSVEIAWGADLLDVSGSGWAWVDVTTDVRMADGISVSLGRNDEASSASPAKMDLTLDNSLARYSLGGRSPNWPYVRRNVPVRVSIDPADGAGGRVVFQGYAVGFTPGWDVSTGRVPVAKLEAAGVLRRIGQGKDPLRSSLYRYLTLSTSPVEYWPLEEEKTAVQAVSPAGGAPATFAPIDSGGILYGKVAWGDDTDNPATERAVALTAGGALSAPVRPGAFTNYWAVSWSMRYTSGSGLFSRFTTDDPTSGLNYYGVWYTDGSVEISANVTGSSAPILTWLQGEPYVWDDVWHDYVMTCDQRGSSVVTTLYRDGVQVATNTANPGYRTAPKLVTFTSVPDPTGTEDPVTVAHLALWNTPPDLAKLHAASTAHVGELADARLVRLCAEEAVPIDVVGATLVTMGPQLPVAFLDLARECEGVDLGVLYDGVGPGLRYVCRDVRENATEDLALDATELVMPFEPVDDDQRTRNRVTATGTSGAKFTYEATAGALGSSIIGVYDSSLTVNVESPDDVPSYAAWAVHLGTVEGYRYPSVALNMRATPLLAPAVLALEPSARVGVESVGSVLAAMPEDDVDLLVEGLAMRLSPYRWDVTLKCSPYGPWVVAVYAATTGDAGPHVARLDTSGAALAASSAAGATSISVATTAGPLWTTEADDYPLLLDVGGIPVRATACSGSSSPQTFTVDALPMARSAGSPVTVRTTPALGL